MWSALFHPLYFFLGLMLLFGPTAKGQVDTRVLELNRPIDRELKGGESHSYHISLKAQQFMHVVVEQRGIDLSIELFDMDGNKLFTINDQSEAVGLENLYWI